MLDEFERQLPTLSAALGPLDDARANGDHERVADIFARIQPVSIDYGVMEHADKVKVVPALFGWSDVGHWDALPDVAPTDDNGNVVRGEVIAIDATGSVLLAGEGRLVAAVGVTDMVVVDTEDAVLIVPRNRAQDVRDVVRELRTRDDSLL